MSMGWKQTFSTDELLCFEDKSKAVSSRIESRKTDDGWIIYKTFYNENGLNHTEEYIAPTYDKMKQVVNSLQSEKKPTLSQLRDLMLEKSKRVTVRVERAFKEYNVEKWRFAVNNETFLNFVLVRCYDEIDLDIVLHEAYKSQEQSILDELVNILGFEGMEDSLNITCYYFSKQDQKQFEVTEDSVEFI